MDTPICDFVKKYCKKNPLRLHMPGHKGIGFLGFEQFDITEIDGADSLYDADGIINKSEKNASAVFGCETFYSTEGSSLCIKAMMLLIATYSKSINKKPLILAARNAHKAFLNAAALIDFDIIWMKSSSDESYLSSNIEPKELDTFLTKAKTKPAAVYITSPDYLGKTAKIKSIADVCHKHGCLLAVDNAHGAYLKFLNESAHPIDLGADICCDSAHKTLPALTGGAYLHISPTAPSMFAQQAKNALALFGSTSPSYLILQSLDAVNKYLTSYKNSLNEFLPLAQKLKDELKSFGYSLFGDEPLKITIEAKKYGYDGFQLAQILKQNDIICEFCDPDYLVLMLTPENGSDSVEQIKEVLKHIKRLPLITQAPPPLNVAEKILSPRQAMLSPSEKIMASDSLGRVLSAPSVGCPPAVPIIVSGEMIDQNAVDCFKYYGIKSCDVVIKT